MSISGHSRATKLRGPDWSFEYREGDRSFQLLWEPRESGVYVPLILDAWTAPPGVPTTAEERERILTGLWRVAKDAGASGLLEHLPDGVEIARRLEPPQGFRIAERPPFLDYMELGRTLSLPLTRDPSAPLVPRVALVDEARWTTGGAVSRADRDRIARRLSEHGVVIG